MRSQKIITAGSITQEAYAFLLKNGATIESLAGLFVVTLPASVEIAHPTASLPHQYGIDWNGDIDADWIAIDLDIDAQNTRISLKRS